MLFALVVVVATERLAARPSEDAGLAVLNLALVEIAHKTIPITPCVRSRPA